MYHFELIIDLIILQQWHIKAILENDFEGQEMIFKVEWAKSLMGKEKFEIIQNDPEFSSFKIQSRRHLKNKRVVVEWANTSEFAKRVGKGVAV